MTSRRRQEMTPEIARAAAHDAGNRSMRLAGRSVWSREDLDVAATEYERLLSITKDANP